METCRRRGSFRIEAAMDSCIDSIGLRDAAVPADHTKTTTSERVKESCVVRAVTVERWSDKCNKT